MKHSLKKIEKEQFSDYFLNHVNACGEPLFPENKTPHSNLNFGSNIIETNCNRAFINVLCPHIDKDDGLCASCAAENADINSPKGDSLMFKDSLKKSFEKPKGLRKNLRISLFQKSLKFRFHFQLWN